MHQIFKRVLFLSILTSTIFLMLIGLAPKYFSKLNAQQDNKNKKIEKRKEVKPIPLAPEENDLQKRIARGNKSRSYNRLRGENLYEQGENEIFGRVSEAAPPSPLPFSDSKYSDNFRVS